MGDFFEDLGKKITETADMITKKTERVMEIQKLQNQIRNLEPYHELCENLKQRRNDRRS